MMFLLVGYTTTDCTEGKSSHYLFANRQHQKTEHLYNTHFGSPCMALYAGDDHSRRQLHTLR